MTPYTVDTDGVTGDYSSLSAAIAALPAVWIDDYEITCQATTDVADTTAVDIDGFTIGAYTLTIQAASNEEAVEDGWKTDRYRLVVSGARVIDVDVGSVTIDGLQIGADQTADYWWLVDVADGITGTTIKNCRLRLYGAAHASWEAVRAASAITVHDCIIENNSSNVCQYGLNLGNVAGNVVWHNTIRGFVYGIGAYSSTLTAENNAVFDNTDDFSVGSGNTIDYNASDDGDGTNAIAPSGADWDNEYNASATGDFTLLNGGNLYQSAPRDGSYLTDIEGRTRDTPNTAPGATEYEAPAGGGNVSGVMTSSIFESGVFGGSTIQG